MRGNRVVIDAFFRWQLGALRRLGTWNQMGNQKGLLSEFARWWIRQFCAFSNNALRCSSQRISGWSRTFTPIIGGPCFLSIKPNRYFGSVGGLSSESICADVGLLLRFVVIAFFTVSSFLNDCVFGARSTPLIVSCASRRSPAKTAWEGAFPGRRIPSLSFLPRYGMSRAALSALCSPRNRAMGCCCPSGWVMLTSCVYPFSSLVSSRT